MPFRPRSKAKPHDHLFNAASSFSRPRARNHGGAVGTWACGRDRMSKDRWHILDDGAELVLARHLPVRMDVAASVVLADGSRHRVARQVRQDMWRALQTVRGFSPVVRVRREQGRLMVCAGGRVAAPFNKAVLEHRIADVLNKPEARARWINYARAGA